jgi:hypothetical protein
MTAIETETIKSPAEPVAKVRTSVRRYNLVEPADMEEQPDGEYVAYADYAALLAAEVAKLVHEYSRRTGKAPSIVYFGRRQRRHFTDLLTAYFVQGLGKERAQFMGLDVYRVDAPSHLDVGRPQ